MVNIVDTLDNQVRIRRALVSVSDKSGLEMLIPGLLETNPEMSFYSTGGTYRRIAEILGERATAHLIRVSDYTGQPETQGGLVKTLDFKIYLGLLSETYNAAHQADLARNAALPLDMVVVNLYPFAETVARTSASVEEARANIDIGGPCMLRAAAKNYLRVIPVVDPGDYADLLVHLRTTGGVLDLATRFTYASKAFAHTAHYDATIAAFLQQQSAEQVTTAYQNLVD